MIFIERGKNMNIISKKKQGVIAIICAIAMIVTSLTIYNPRETKADNTDYSTLEFTKVTEPMDSTYAYCITENTLTDFGRLKFYGTYFMQVIGSGNSKMKEATVTIDGKVQTDTTIAFDRADAITGFNVSNLSNNAYHELKIEGDGGNITIILKKGSVNGETEESTELKAPAAPDGLVANINDVKTNYTIAFANVATATSYKFYLGEKFVKEITNGGVVTIAELQLVEGQTYTFGVSAVNAAGESAISTVEVTVPSKSEETTEPTEPTEPFDPSTITDWTPVGSSTIMSYYIANDADGKVNVKPEMHGDNVYAAFGLAAKFKSVSLNGEAVTPRDGADIEIAKTSFKEGYNKLEVTDFYGKETVTIYFKVAKAEETTTSSSGETTEPFDPSTITDWTAVTGSTTMSYYIANGADGKVNVKPEMHVDNVYVAFTIPAKFKSVSLNGEAVTPRDGADVEIAKTSFNEGYNKLEVTDFYGKETVTIYFKVAKEKATHTVTVDGTPNSVTEGSTYTFGNNAQGYYDATNSVAYASGEEITVNSDITVTSINLNVAMQKGASVRLATPTGLRFQTVITSGNDIAVSDILNKDFVTTGTLITTFDLFSANGNKLDKDSQYTKLDIANSGWYGDEVGKFCGSIIKINKDNYEKKFVGVGYATITYNNGKTLSIYANVNEADNARSIYYVANAVKDAGYKNCNAAQIAIIDKYIAKEEL